MWIDQACQSIDPNNKIVQLQSGAQVNFDFLVVATGLKLAWNRIEGLEGNLGKNGICSIYEYDQVDKVSQMLEAFNGGTAIFVMPPVPIKCAGAPQKIMYLADDIFIRNGVKSKSKVVFTTPGKAMFGVPTFSKALDGVVQRRGIVPLFSHKLVAVDANKNVATFEVTGSDGSIQKTNLAFDLLHVVPPMAAPTLIADSGLAFTEGDQKGWMAVDKHTLQSLKYPNIFGVGDVTGVPNSKTAAAIRKQVPVVVQNLLSVMKGQKSSAAYDGYSSCPLVTGFGKVILAEFGYDGKLMPSFPIDATVERKSMWILKRHMLPILYWNGMLKGRA
jgi:sulfide:quinone oxidoreductase